MRIQRKRHNLTRGELASKLGLNESDLVKYENGLLIEDQAAPITELLYDYFLGGEEPE